MESRNDILNELQALSPALATASRELPYQVPAGYFDQFADRMLQRVRALEAATAADELSALSPLLSGLSRQTPFTTPEGYFPGLTEQAVAGARAIDFVQDELEKQDEPESLLPLLQQLQQQTVYEVPAGYFEALPGMILERAKKEETVVANFKVRPAFAEATADKAGKTGAIRRFIRYAAAAVVTGIIGLSAWWYLRPTPDPAQAPAAVVAGFEKVSDDELLQYLDSENGTPPIAYETTAVSGSDEITGNDMKDLLADVSDEELQQYLDKYSPDRKLITN